MGRASADTVFRNSDSSKNVKFVITDVARNGEPVVETP